MVVDGLNDRPWIYGNDKRGGYARTVVYRRGYSIGDRSGCYAGSVSECLGWDVSAAAGGQAGNRSGYSSGPLKRSTGDIG